MRRIEWLFIIFAVLLLAACSSPKYRGYKYGVYTVRGETYYPMAPRDAIGYEEIGIASHYQEGNWLFPGKTAIGEKLYPNTAGAAHKTLPLPCRIRITNLQNGRSTEVRVNDRGPFIPGRIIDVTAPVAKKLRFHNQGLTRVKIEVIDVGDGKHRIRR